MDTKEATLFINNAAAPSVTRQLVKVEVKMISTYIQSHQAKVIKLLNPLCFVIKKPSK